MRHNNSKIVGQTLRMLKTIEKDTIYFEDLGTTS